MTIQIDLPDELESTLREKIDNFDAFAKELLLVELYRRDLLAHHELAQATRLSRYEVDGVLKRHGIDYELTMEELNEQIRHIRSLRG